MQRFAYRTFSQEPDIDYDGFKRQLGEHFFGSSAVNAEVADFWTCNEFGRSTATGTGPRRFYILTSSPSTLSAANWSTEKLAVYDHNLATLHEIASRNTNSANPTAQEMSRLAKMVVARWDKSQAIPSQSNAKPESAR